MPPPCTLIDSVQGWAHPAPHADLIPQMAKPAGGRQREVSPAMIYSIDPEGSGKALSRLDNGNMSDVRTAASPAYKQKPMPLRTAGDA